MSAPVEVRRYDARCVQPLHRHDTASISLVVRGTIDETCEGATAHAFPGDVIVKPAGVIHGDRYGDRGAVTVTVRCDAAALPYRVRFAGTALRLFAIALDDWNDGNFAPAIVAEIAAALHDDRPRPRSKRMTIVAEHVVRSNDSVERIAESLGMHPVALARSFRREHGVSITELRQQTRTRAAARLLATAMPLGEVALESGYSDQSHFCRLFRRETGLTPSEFRRLVV